MFKIFFQFIKLSIIWGGPWGAGMGALFGIFWAWGGHYKGDPVHVFLVAFVILTLLGIITFGPFMAYQEIGDFRKIQRERESLTCAACGALAEPIDGTRDRYKCTKCSIQFAGAKHSL